MVQRASTAAWLQAAKHTLAAQTHLSQVGNVVYVGNLSCPYYFSSVLAAVVIIAPSGHDHHSHGVSSAPTGGDHHSHKQQ
jgi:hypothetical protein